MAGFEVSTEACERRLALNNFLTQDSHKLWARKRGHFRPTLLHGVPPSPLGAMCFGQQEVTPFFFFHKPRDRSYTALRWVDSRAKSTLRN